MTANLEPAELEYLVEYSKRKFVEVRIDEAGRIRVSAPKGASEAAIRIAVNERRPWIETQLKALETVLSRVANGPKERVWADGEKFLYQGKGYPISIHVDPALTEPHVQFKNKVLEIHTAHDDEATLRALLKKHYTRACKTLIIERLNHFQPLIGVKSKSMSIEDSQSKWGTCNSAGHLMFNWRLIMAPTDVVDYLVIHELCHLKHMNHDRSFWRLVGKYCTDYEKKQAWLACYNAHMSL